MTDRSAAEQLILRSWRIIDLDGGAGVEALFAEEGTLRFGDAVNRGRDGIRLVYAQRRERGERTSRHLVANLLWSQERDRVIADYALTLFAADGPAPVRGAAPVGVFDVRDVVRVGDGVPLIETRALSTVFADPDRGLAVSFRRSAVERSRG